MKKNIKGFTLIELLAVIVILAIIAVIATPIVINVINDSKKKAFENTAYGVIEAAKNKYVQNQLNNKIEDIVVDFSDKKNLDMSGIKPKGGQAISTAKGVSIAVYDGKYCAIKGINDNKIEIINYDITTCKIKEKGTVKGKVIVNNIQNVADKVATIQFKSDNKVIASTKTDSEGNYTLTDVPYGNYEIIVINGKDYYSTYLDYGYKVIQPTNALKDIKISYGDFNKDSVIGNGDLKMFYTCYMQTITESNQKCALYDVDKDKVVNTIDLAIMHRNMQSALSFSSNNLVSLIIKAEYLGNTQPTILLNNLPFKGFKPTILEDGSFLLKDIPAGVYTFSAIKKYHTKYYNEAFALKSGTYTLKAVLHAGSFYSDNIEQIDLDYFNSFFPQCENKPLSDPNIPSDCSDFDVNEDGVVTTIDRDIIVKNIGKKTEYAVGIK